MTAFDRVEIREAGCDVQVLTLEEFCQLKLRERVRHLLSNHLSFFLDGRPLRPADALESLQKR